MTDFNILFLWLGNLMGIQNLISKITSSVSLNHKSQFPVYGPISTKFFTFNWKSLGIPKPIPQMSAWTMDRFQPNIFLSTGKFLHEIYVLQFYINFWIMILCKINFDKIWYSVIFADNLYYNIYVFKSTIVVFKWFFFFM